MEEDTRVGAMISQTHAERVLKYIDIARQEVSLKNFNVRFAF